MTSEDDAMKLNVKEIDAHEHQKAVEAKRTILAALATRQGNFNAAGLPVYIGHAAPGTATSAALWRIQKLSYDASNRLTTIEWADGNGEFDNIWDDRATLSYS